MDYKKFFNSNPSAAGNSAVTNIKALQEMQLWLGGQEIIDISVGESQDTYTPLTFTKENGDTYTVNIPTVKGVTGSTGDKGLEALSITTIYKATSIPTPSASFTLTTNDFNRIPTTNESAIMFVVTDDSTEAYITSVVVTSVSDDIVNCMYESVQYIVVNSLSPNEFNYMGKWVQNNDYHKNDCVYYKDDNLTYVDTFYICIEDVSNSTASPNNDSTHWAPISTNASKYKEDYTIFIGEGLQIRTSGSIKLSDGFYIHFVTLEQNTNDIELIINTFCITNSANSPSLDDFETFVSSVAPDADNCIMASGRLNNLGTTKALVNGLFDRGGSSLYVRLCYISK